MKKALIFTFVCAIAGAVYFISLPAAPAWCPKCGDKHSALKGADCPGVTQASPRPVIDGPWCKLCGEVAHKGGTDAVPCPHHSK